MGGPLWRHRDEGESLFSLNPLFSPERCREMKWKREESYLTEWGRPLKREHLKTELGRRLKVEIILLTSSSKLGEEQGNTWKLGLLINLDPIPKLL